MWVSFNLAEAQFPHLWNGPSCGFAVRMTWAATDIITIRQGRSGQRGLARVKDLRWADGSNTMKASWRKKRLRSLRRGRVNIFSRSEVCVIHFERKWARRYLTYQTECVWFSSAYSSPWGPLHCWGFRGLPCVHPGVLETTGLIQSLFFPSDQN